MAVVGSVTAHNTFDQPANVVPKSLDGITVADGVVRVKLPAESVVVLAVE